jgi:hypothetical protein
VLESLRNKQFSFSSISETARELGRVNRTLVAENFRGVVLKTLVENDFDIDIALKQISGSDHPGINKRVENKIETFLANIKNDIQNQQEKEFAALKSAFSSKYRNLPQRFHLYLDEVIKHFLKN